MAGGIGTRRPFKLVDETPTITDGRSIANEVTVLRGWANLDARKSNTLDAGGQTLLEQFFVFRFPYRGTIAVNQNTKIICDGKRYTIHSIQKENNRPFFWSVIAEALT